METLIASFESVGLDVNSSIDIAAGFAEPGVGVMVYRVVQEGLTNAHRYGTGAATVEVRVGDGQFCVTVLNPVSPTTARGAQPGGGLGLIGMRERVESLGGRLTVDDVGDRFLVRAELGSVRAVQP